MPSVRTLTCLALGLACFVGPRLRADDTPGRARAANATKKTEATKFLRLARDAKGEPTALETATVRYAAPGAGGVTVDLIGVVHIGEKAYYQALNKQMEQYDVLLYELVAPEGTVVPKGGKGKSDNPLSMLQGMMKSMLDLELQLEHIDYTKKNFVHADLSPEKMAEAMKERGEDALTLGLGVVADFMRKANLEEQKRQKEAAKAGKQLEDLDLFSLLLDPNAGSKLKRIMAEQFDSEGDLGLGQTLNALLVEDRNKACLQVLGREMAKGKKKIGIFYGAAHMADFEKRLKDEYELKKSTTDWLTAWDLKAKRGLKTPPLLKLFGDQ